MTLNRVNNSHDFRGFQQLNGETKPSTNEADAARLLRDQFATPAKNPLDVRQLYRSLVGYDAGEARKYATLKTANAFTAPAKAARTAAAKPPVNTSFPSPNYSSRRGMDIDTVVLHHTGSDSDSGALSTLTNGRAKDRVSAHYLIGKDGTIYQLVDDQYRAWHAGEGALHCKPTDINGRSIGIEIVSSGKPGSYTEAQYKALEKLVPHLMQKYDVPPQNLVGHKDVAIPAGRKNDPANFDFDRIRKAVNGGVGNDPGQPAPVPKPPKPAPPTAPGKTTAPSVDLQRGDRGAEVRKLQAALVKLGYMTQAQVNTGPGTFGPRTFAAVQKFQRDHNVPDTGYYGPLTRAALGKELQTVNQATAPSDNLRRGDQGAEVRQLQAALVKLGYMTQAQVNTGPGTFGPRTFAAVQRFQRDHNVPDTGFYGPLTRAALKKALGGDAPTAKPNDPTRPAPTQPPGGGGAINLDNIVGVKGNPNVTPEFKQKVNEIAKRLGTKPEYLMAIMSFESGGSFSPAKRNPDSDATGLIQFLPSTARGLLAREGVNVSDARAREIFAGMSPLRQLDYVEKYFQPFKGKLNTLEGAYTAVLSGRAHSNPNDVLFRAGTRAYSHNSGLDLNKDGQITAGEATTPVAVRLFGGASRVQQKLKDAGFDPGKIDGQFGPNTSRALARFQRSRNLPATGLLDEKTGVELGLAGVPIAPAPKPKQPQPDKAPDQVDGKPRQPTDSVPSGVPARGTVRSNFGYRTDPFTGARKFHGGIDIAAPTGTRVNTTANGKVIFASENGNGFGKHIIIDHGNGYKTLYAHLSEINVKRGQAVTDKQKIGEVGSTGRSTGPHLHYEVRRNDERVDPKRYL